MRGKFETEVNLKYSNGKLKVEKDLAPENSECQYTHLMKNESTEYVLRGFCIPFQTTDSTSQERPEDCLEQMSRMYEEYFLMKAVNCFNLHISKPLCLDYAIDVRNKSIHIKIIFECSGTAWSEWKSINIKQVCSLMKQSANTFLLLRNLGATNLDIKPSEVIYSYSKDELKFIGAGKCLNKIIQSKSIVNRKKKVVIVE
eukprot:TRINITY_DN7343_c0_g1_i8.p1 TRINITY_DN7343_c0_g1~~TRINITY_DN7343_c0_g1_i8.p1  ORF type:complete len:200 (+),score=25.74 TRINITY_DN7343_c0_g1_i8:249-848(+)